ncbi:hypothetical protein KBD49_12825 [Myxococcota bacterium]|jgi:hypothetical protein|nr:hypothetical protein [Myxococcota bacterium]
MTEREIREILQRVCDGLLRDLAGPVARRAAPAALGIGLAGMSGCPADSPPVVEYAAPDIVQLDGQVRDLPAGDPGSDAFVPPDVLYMGPDPGTDPGPVPPYMAPDSGPQPEYMAPDSGPVPPYMAPDSGPQPEYMAPDSGPMPLYMAPSRPGSRGS